MEKRADPILAYHLVKFIHRKKLADLVGAGSGGNSTQRPSIVQHDL